MGVPLPIIFVIVMMMSLFAVAAGILFKKRHLLTQQPTIELSRKQSPVEQED